MCDCLSRAPYWGPGLQPRHMPWLGLNWPPLGSQAGTQSTQPHQPVSFFFFFLYGQVIFYCICTTALVYLNPHLRICLLIFFFEREGKGKRERNIDVKKKHWLVASLYVPQPGIEPSTRLCSLTGPWTCNLLVYRMTFEPTEPPGQGCATAFLSACLLLGTWIASISRLL